MHTNTIDSFACPPEKKSRMESNNSSSDLLSKVFYKCSLRYQVPFSELFLTVSTALPPEISREQYENRDMWEQYENTISVYRCRL